MTHINHTPASSNIIYHDFRQNDMPKPVYFTQQSLTKGRRFLKFVSNINPTLNTICAYLCGTCMALSMTVFVIFALYA